MFKNKIDKYAVKAYYTYIVKHLAFDKSMASLATRRKGSSLNDNLFLKLLKELTHQKQDKTMFIL